MLRRLMTLGALIAVLSAVLAVPAVAATTVNVRAFGAKGNGIADDTAAVRKAMNKVAARGGGTVRVPRGTYLVSTITIPAHVAITGAGSGRSWIHGRIVAGGQVALSGLKLGTAGKAFHFARGAHGSTFTHCRFVGGGGMSSGSEQGVVGFDGWGAHDLTFTACVVGRNASNGNGVSMGEGRNGHYENILFQRCRFQGQPRMDFECTQRGGQGYRHIDLVKCVFGRSVEESVSFDGTSTAGYCRVEGCTFKGAGVGTAGRWPHALEVNGPSQMVITGSTFYSSRGANLNLDGGGGSSASPGSFITVSNNSFRTAGKVKHSATSPYFLVGGSGILVTGNTVRAGAGSQVFYIYGGHNAFTNNAITVTASDSPTHIFFLQPGPGTVVTGNTVHAAGKHIIVHSGSGGSVFRDNVFVTGQTQQQLFRIDSGVSVTIAGNTCQ